MPRERAKATTNGKKGVKNVNPKTPDDPKKRTRQRKIIPVVQHSVGTVEHVSKEVVCGKKNKEVVIAELNKVENRGHLENVSEENDVPPVKRPRSRRSIKLFNPDSESGSVEENIQGGSSALTDEGSQDSEDVSNKTELPPKKRGRPPGTRKKTKAPSTAEPVFSRASDKLDDAVCVQVNISESDQAKARNVSNPPLVEVVQDKCDKQVDDKISVDILEEVCKRCKTTIHISDSSKKLETMLEHAQNCPTRLSKDILPCSKCMFVARSDADFRSHVLKNHLNKSDAKKESSSDIKVKEAEAAAPAPQPKIRGALQDKLMHRNIPIATNEVVEKDVERPNIQRLETESILDTSKLGCKNLPQVELEETNGHWCIQCKSAIVIADPDKIIQSLVNHCQNCPKKRKEAMILCYQCELPFKYNGDLLRHITKTHMVQRSGGQQSPRAKAVESSTKVTSPSSLHSAKTSSLSAYLEAAKKSSHSASPEVAKKSSHSTHPDMAKKSSHSTYPEMAKKSSHSTYPEVAKKSLHSAYPGVPKKTLHSATPDVAKMYNCGICLGEFGSAEELQRHMHTHLIQ